MKKFIFIVVLSFSCFFVFSQTKEEKAYKKDADEMRASVWAWEDEKFKVRTVPNNYKSVSKVIIAHHLEIAGQAKRSSRWRTMSNFTEILREVIKLNDKAAINEYSELSFDLLQKSYGYYSIEQKNIYVGVRIIKPDGKVIEINPDEMVLTKNESGNKKGRLAIPDLQPGDIIDYFIASETKGVNTISLQKYTMLFVSDAPILSYSVHGELGGKYALEYMLYNNPPEFKIVKNDEDDIILDIDLKDLQASETQLWVSPLRQFPIIKFNIFIGYKDKGEFQARNKPGSVTRITNSNEVLNRRYESFSFVNWEGYLQKKFYNSIIEDAKKIALKYSSNYETMSVAEKAALLFYTYRLKYRIAFDIYEIAESVNMGVKENNEFAYDLFAIFYYADLNPGILLTESRMKSRFHEAMEGDEFLNAVVLPGNLFFNMSSIYDMPFVLAEDMEGADSTRRITFKAVGKLGFDKYNLTVAEKGPSKLPVTTSDKNARIEKLSLQLIPEKSLLQTQRTTVLRGYYKKEIQKQILLYEDLYEYERVALKMEKGLIEDLMNDKFSKKIVPEIKNAFEEARKKQTEAVVTEAKNWFEQDIAELKDFKIINPGVRHTAPDFIYSSSFQLNGLVKKAGNNFIIEIGKMQGQPLVVKEEHRNRTLDVYMPYARSIEYEIELAIPEGYTAEGVEALNSKVENETGFFITEAKTDGKTVFIKIKKHYLHNFEPAANFSKLTAFMDASVNWTNAKLLLKKK